MRHNLPSGVRGSSEAEAGDGARRCGECVSTFRFDQGAGTINRQSCLSAPFERRAAAAARRSGSHRRLHAHDLRRRRRAGARAAPTGHRSMRHATIEALADQLAGQLDRAAGDGKPALARTLRTLPRTLPDWADGAGRRVLIADADGTIIASIPDGPPSRGAPSSTCSDRGSQSRRSAPMRTPSPITLPDGDHRTRHRAGVAKPARYARRPAAARRCARGLALDHGADHDAVGDHRLRRAHPRLRLSLAGDTRARGRPDPRHGARPHRHRTQSRPLRAVGLGSGARPRVLVALDVRHSRPAAEGRTAHIRRGQRAGACRRHQSLRSGHTACRRQRAIDSITPSACATPTAAGCGCGRVANWRARMAKPACT